jgi:hypothetical protein
MAKKTDELVVSGFCAPRSVHGLLRDAARGIQKVRGGKVSASGILVMLLKENEQRLKDMARGKIQ